MQFMVKRSAKGARRGMLASAERSPRFPVDALQGRDAAHTPKPFQQLVRQVHFLKTWL